MFVTERVIVCGTKVTVAGVEMRRLLDGLLADPLECAAEPLDSYNVVMVLRVRGILAKGGMGGLIVQEQVRPQLLISVKYPDVICHCCTHPYLSAQLGFQLLILCVEKYTCIKRFCGQLSDMMYARFGRHKV